MSKYGHIQGVESEFINWDEKDYYNPDKPRKDLGTTIKIELFVDNVDIVTQIIKNLGNRRCEPVLALLNCVEGEMKYE